MANYENENWNRERNRGFDPGEEHWDPGSEWDNPERRGWNERRYGPRPDDRYGANEERYGRFYGTRSNWGGSQDRGWSRGDEGWRTAANEGWGRGEPGWRGNETWVRGDERYREGQWPRTQDWRPGEYPRRETWGRGSAGYPVRSDFRPQGSYGSMENYGVHGNYNWQYGYGGGLGAYGAGTGSSTHTGGSSYMGGFGSYAGERGRYAGRGPKGWRRSDDRIREDINERLTDHPDIDASDVDVQVKDGEVTLTGTVDERHAKRLAEDIAEQVTGVKDVHNNLRVQRREMAHQGTAMQTTGTTSATGKK